MNFTEKLKAALWHCYGHPEYPAEWDGKIYGGGKLSQRFWEYFIAVELLNLTPDSVVLDIGGGSPATGAGFFTRVIAPHVREVHVMDLNIGPAAKQLPNIRFHRSLSNYESLSKLLKDNRQITHVASISVFEHIPHDVRCGMVKAINEFFAGDTFVATLEFHAKERFFEDQLTAHTLSGLFEPLTSFYPAHICKSPIQCENAFQGASLGREMLRRLGSKNRRGKDVEIPLWYPLALKFQRMAPLR